MKEMKNVNEEMRKWECAPFIPSIYHQ